MNKMANIRKYKTKSGRTGYRIHWLDYQGKRRSKVLYISKTSARQTAERLELQALEIKNGIRPRPDESLPLEVCKTRFLKSAKMDGRSPQTITRYEKVFKPFLTKIGSDTPLQSITSTVIEEYKDWRVNNPDKEKRVKPISMNTELRHLKALFSWSVKQDYLVKSPFLGVKMLKTENKPVRFLSEAEIKKLYETIAEKEDQRSWDLVTFYLQTGARATEILEVGGFTWGSVHEDHIEIIGKGRKRRQIPLNSTLREILDRRRGERAPFPYSYSAVSQSLSRKLFDKAGFADANLHTLRKTAGALLIQAGVDIYRVSKFLGHSSVKVTEQHYVDLLQADYADMSEILEQSALPNDKVGEHGVSSWSRVA
jgi:integrase/recombinase XerD